MATIKRTIEEKAKAYDERLAKARKEYSIHEANNAIGIMDALERVFPELAESEDERIRKALVQFFKEKDEEDFEEWVPKAKVLAWLEKQWEQKSADKVEPKFKVGDWVVYDGWVCQIIDVTEDGYCNSEHGFIPQGREDSMRLWTIQDAKEGDVLCDCCEEYDNPLIFILKKFERVDFGLMKPSDYSSYCFLTAGERQIFKEGKYHHKHNIKPATKEQRDLLFKKMHEAGYEWDAEKKELKKIEQKPQRMVSAEAKEAMYNKPAWSEEDEKFLAGIIANLEYLMDRANTDTLKQSLQKRIDWLKFLKDRVGCEVNCTTPKEWSEEDEKMCQETIDWFENKCFPYALESENPAKESIKWLKSLKGRVQPKQEWSEEDKEIIINIGEYLNRYGNYIVESNEEKAADVFKSADWLKSLIPQNWTKEDKERCISCLQRLGTGDPKQPETINSKWFKEHVYPQPTWKPSEEQINLLEELIEDNNQRYFYNILKSLYEQLKKLREE